MRFSSVILLALATHSANAFSTGAGGCASGMAAVGGGHLGNPSITTGSLSEGGLAVEIAGVPAAEATLTVGVPTEVTVSGTEFRGVLVMTDAPFVSILPDDDALQPAQACAAVGAIGITHVINEFKEEAAGIIECDGVGIFDMGVTVVISNNANDGSAYYYTGYTLECVAEESIGAATADPTMNLTETLFPFDFNETEFPFIEFNETEFPFAEGNETDFPFTEGNETSTPPGETVIAPPSTAPVSIPTTASGAEAASAAVSTTSTTTMIGGMLLSVGATVAAMWM